MSCNKEVMAEGQQDIRDSQSIMIVDIMNNNEVIRGQRYQFADDNPWKYLTTRTSYNKNPGKVTVIMIVDIGLIKEDYQ